MTHSSFNSRYLDLTVNQIYADPHIRSNNVDFCCLDVPEIEAIEKSRAWLLIMKLDRAIYKTSLEFVDKIVEQKHIYERLVTIGK